MEFKINTGSSFKTVKNGTRLVQNKKAIEHYFKNFDAALRLKNNIPIFLDTNVFLRYYSKSFKQKESLNQFFLERKKQIIIAQQVQWELIQNRGGTIENNFQIARQKTSQKPKDESLIPFSAFQRFDHLNEEELNFLKEEFNLLSDGIDPQKLTSEIKKTKRVFPGMGDIKGKPENPYGDYILFHEMIKYAKEYRTDVVFLTYDSAKGDWLSFNKEPHIHYIQSVYEINSKSIYVIDANQFFANLFSISRDDSLIADLKEGEDDFAGTDLEEEIILNFFVLHRMVRLIAVFLLIDKRGKKTFNKIIRAFHDEEVISEVMFQELRKISFVRSELTDRDDLLMSNNFTKLELQETLASIRNCIKSMTEMFSKL